ncbi:uncharacterized protein LOC113315857 [Papaver somniferum]|uniref:uncharacterized protein LOC113315857 n=1 Tax=Papaver somniferum TaxID=3469 RepID=UPI000E6F7672|nr:uncharacterized protein LOC113315857 [Papaver somniferum]
MGFETKWRSWVKCCVEYVKFSVIINGSAAGYFKRNKGIRQGDPLSSFLFLLVGKALSYMIKQTQDKGLISGFQTVDGGKMVSHLQFADDTLIFIDASIEQVQQPRLLRISIELITGLKINFAKSQIYGVGYEGDLHQFSSILGCFSETLRTTFFGLPL